MPAIQLSCLEMNSDRVVIRPMRADSEIVRTEGKYDRHGFGEVIAFKRGTKIGGIPLRKGDVVVYDDSDAVEFPIIEEDSPTEQVECVHVSKIYGIEGDNC